MSLPAALFAAAALAGPPRLDLSSQVPSTQPVATRSAGACAGREDDVYAVAIVIYGRQRGRSAWGHISVRFLACVAGAFRDVEYEATVVDDTLIDWYAAAFPDEEWYFALDFLDRHADRLVWFRNEGPVDTGLYRDELDKNREITELWMPGWSGPAARALMADFDTAYDAQLADLRAGRTLDRPEYKALSDNCTLPIRAAADALGLPTEGGPDSVFPMVWLRQLADHPEVAVVVHPSPGMLQHIQRQTGDLKAAYPGAPTMVYRPLFRRSLHEDTLDAFRARVSERATPIAVDRVLSALPPVAPPPDPTPR